MKSVVCIFISLFFSFISIAQNSVPFFSENHEQINATYQQLKGNLPSYFFTYGLGGANADESFLEEATMEARSYVIPMPVLITSNKMTPPFDLWLAQLYTNDAANTKISTSNVALPQESKMTYEEKIANEQAQNPRDSAQIAKDEQFREDKVATANKLAMQKENAAAKNNSVKNNSAKNNSVKDKSQKNKTSKEKTAPNQVPLVNAFNPIPDSIQSKINEMGTKAGYQWLYKQQIIAGNVVFCSPQTAAPIALNIEVQGAEKEYLVALEAWKKAYPSIWQKSEMEQHKAIAENFENYFTEFGKSSAVGFNFNNYIELYKQERQDALAK